MLTTGTTAYRRKDGIGVVPLALLALSRRSVSESSTGAGLRRPK